MPNDNCGNPLLQQWVKEWMDQANNLQSKSYYTYKKAYDSLTKCPITYNHPEETIVLTGIGAGMVKRFEEKMREYCKENGLPMPESQKKKKSREGSSSIEDSTTPIKKRPPKTYVPGYRTGGYGILLYLLYIYEVGRENVTKEQICRAAQEYCDSSYTLADPGKSYTAWNSIKILEQKGYVYKNGKPAKYCLTETGLEIAKRIRDLTNSNALGLPSSSTARQSSNNSTFASDETEVYRNLPVARGLRRKTDGSSTSTILDSMLDYDDDSANGLDLSLYVFNPSERQSITVNGRTSNGVASGSNSSSNNNERSSSDILYDLADASRCNKRKGNGNSRGGYKKQRQSKPKSTTAAYLDRLMAEFDNQSSTELDMSKYVMNPSNHQSISLNGRTVQNRPSSTSTSSSSSVSTPNVRNVAKPTSRAKNSNGTSSSSSITSSNTSSFTRSVMNTKDDDIFDWDSDRLSLPSSSKKYSTPSNSRILQADNNKKATPTKSKISKPTYNVDEYNIDLSPPLLPTLKSSQSSNIQPNDIVDLLSSPEASPILQPSASQLDQDITFDNNLDVDEDYFPLSQSRTKQIKDDVFHYTYLDTDEKDVRSAAQAAIAFDEGNSCLAFRIRFYTSQSDHPKAKSLTEVAKDGAHIGCSIGYISEINRDSVCPGLPARPVLPLHHEEESDDFWPQERNSSSQTNNVRNDYNERLFSSQASQPSSSQQKQQRISSQLTSSSQTSSSTTQQQQSQKIPVDYSQLIESEPIECMLPNEYEIVLVLDSREIQMKRDRNYFQRKLSEKGVNFVTRSLDLGDAMWVARKIGSKNQSDELFLDYIIERKRLDDLVTSIKDGRFVEQKTRLKRSGAEKVIYVVEEYNREDAVKFGWQAVQTAMSSTQIIDGFFLKRTNSVDESIEYIVSLTKLITRIYKNFSLYSIPSHIITRQNYLDLKEAYKAKSRMNVNIKSAYLISYATFSELSTKNGSTSLHEVYLRMLMTVKGVNAERALSLMQVYPTPNSLLKAFKGKSVAEAKNLLRDATQHHISRRRWGTQISERLYNIWGALEYPPTGEDEDD